MVSENRQENDPIDWLEEYGDRLYRFARARVRDSFAAEDLIQETLLAAYRSREKYSGRSNRDFFHPQLLLLPRFVLPDFSCYIFGRLPERYF